MVSHLEKSGHLLALCPVNRGYRGVFFFRKGGYRTMDQAKIGRFLKDLRIILIEMADYYEVELRELHLE